MVLQCGLGLAGILHILHRVMHIFHRKKYSSEQAFEHEKSQTVSGMAFSYVSVYLSVSRYAFFRRLL